MLKKSYCYVFAVMVGLFPYHAYSESAPQENSVIYHHKLIHKNEVDVSSCEKFMGLLTEQGKQGYRLEFTEAHESPKDGYYIFLKSNTTYSYLLHSGQGSKEVLDKQYGEKGYLNNWSMNNQATATCKIYRKNGPQVANYNYNRDTNELKKATDLLEQVKQQSKKGFLPLITEENRTYIKDALMNSNDYEFELVTIKNSKASIYLKKLNEAGEQGYQPSLIYLQNAGFQDIKYPDFGMILLKDNSKNRKYSFGLVEYPKSPEKMIEVLNKLGLEGKYATPCNLIMLKTDKNTLVMYMMWVETKECKDNSCQLIYDPNIDVFN